MNHYTYSLYLYGLQVKWIIKASSMMLALGHFKDLEMLKDNC